MKRLVSLLTGIIRETYQNKIVPFFQFLFVALVPGVLSGCSATGGSGQVDDKASGATVSTFAGGGKGGYANGIGSVALFNGPLDIAIDAAGNLYVADLGNHSIRKVAPDGTVSTFAGSGKAGFADGNGSTAQFRYPSGIAIDKAGNLYVADSGNGRIRKITKKGEVSTLAGSHWGYGDGKGNDARFHGPRGIAIDKAGNLYVVEEGQNSIRKVTPDGMVSTYAAGENNNAESIEFDVEFRAPYGGAMDKSDNLYVTDTHNNCIRKITPKGEVSIFAGNGKEGFADGEGSAAQFDKPRGIAIDAAGNLYVTDGKNRANIRKIAPNGEVSTLVGGVKGFADGAGSGARFYEPLGIAIDVAGNLYVADYGNNRIRKVTPAGEVSTFAGSGATVITEEGFADGMGSAAQFNQPTNIAIDATGIIYVADTWNHRIRRITPEGYVSTLAGSHEEGFADGESQAAKFRFPIDIAIDGAENLYVVDLGNRRIRKISKNGDVSTLAGSGEKGFADGAGSVAQFNDPSGIAIDKAGNLFVTDSSNHRIRKVTQEGVVSTFAGDGEKGFADGSEGAARFYRPSGIAIDSADNLYVADINNNRIRKITPTGNVSTFAGGEEGFADGSGGAARFYRPSAIATDKADNLYVADSRNHRVRKITPSGNVSTLAGSGTSGYADDKGASARFNAPSGVAIDATGNLYVADFGNNRIRKVALNVTRATVSTYRGGAYLWPEGIAADAAGNLYVADTGNHRIRKISPKGNVSTLAGSGEKGSADGKGEAAQFNEPVGIAVDAAGNLYVADSWNHRIRRITPEGEVSTLADDKRKAVRFVRPRGIAIDKEGNLYVTDTDRHRIRKVTPEGEVSTFAGSGNRGFADGLGKAAWFQDPFGIAIDAAGNLYVADFGNRRIRKITKEGNVTTLAGGGAGFADGFGKAAGFASPTGIAIDKAGNLYVSDPGNNLIRKVTPAGEVSLLAGRGEAKFVGPFGIAIDAANNLHVVERQTHSTRKIVIE
ncbi:MAG: hypothetical protein LBE22_08380 [Azoarcus sp.]|jgi:sugar lactone lactonase YvrE|nr:hypothetical protein [Azoarcus sp.]